MQLQRTKFTDMADYLSYEKAAWQEPALRELTDSVNDRFEKLLRGAVNVREEVRQGHRQSDEKIEITIYEWIKRFMDRTKRLEMVDGIEIGGIKGSLEFNLFEASSRFIPEEQARPAEE